MTQKQLKLMVTLLLSTHVANVGEVQKKLPTNKTCACLYLRFFVEKNTHPAVMNAIKFATRRKKGRR